MAYKGAQILVLVHQRLRVFFSFTGGTTREGGQFLSSFHTTQSKNMVIFCYIKSKRSFPFMKILGLFALFFLFEWIMQRYLRKKLQIEKTPWGIYKPMNNTQKWLERSLLMVHLILLWFIDDIFLLTILFFALLNSLRAFMEWKYEKEKKTFVLTLLAVFNILLYGTIFLIFRDTIV